MFRRSCLTSTARNWLVKVCRCLLDSISRSIQFYRNFRPRAKFPKIQNLSIKDSNQDYWQEFCYTLKQGSVLRSIETISAQGARSEGRTRTRRTDADSRERVSEWRHRSVEPKKEQRVDWRRVSLQLQRILLLVLHISYIHIYIMGGTNRGVPHREQEDWYWCWHRRVSHVQYQQ